MLTVKPVKDIQDEILIVALHVLMKCVNVLPAYGRNILLFIGENVLSVSSRDKDCWLRLL